MSFSRNEYERAFGLASFPTARAGTLLTFKEFPGDPNGNVVADFLGQTIFDTANGRFYKAVDVTAKRFALMEAAFQTLANSARFRSPYGNIAGTGIRYQQARFYMGQRNYPEHALQWFLPLYTSNNGGIETAFTTQSIRVIGYSFGYGVSNDPTLATWVRGKIKGGDSYTMTAADGVGVLTDPLLTAAQEIPANMHRWVMFSFDFVDSLAPVVVDYGPGSNLEGVVSSGSEGAFLTTGLTNGVAISSNNGGRVYGPTYSLSKSSKSGRKAILCQGDSIFFGDAGENNASMDFGVAGYIRRGLNVAGGVGPVDVIDITVPGMNPGTMATNDRLTAQNAGLALTNDPTRYQLKFASVDAAGVAPFTHIISEHATNNGFKRASDNGNISTFDGFSAGMKAYIETLRAKWPNKHVAQATAIQKMAATTNGYQTEAGQTEANGFGIGGFVTQWNDKLAADRLDGLVDSAIDARPRLAATGTRTKVKPYPGPINTTITAIINSGSFTLADVSQITRGDAVLIDPDGIGANGQQGAIVTQISGNNIVLSRTISGTVNTGAKVIGTYIMDLVHPSRQGHLEMAPAVTAWREANLAA